MPSVRYLVLCVVIVAASLRSTQAITDEEKEKIKGFLAAGLAECGPQFGVGQETLKDAKDKHDFSDVQQCFFACMFKKAGFINEKGEFDKEKTQATGNTLVSSDEDKKLVANIVDTCSKVNDEEVSDGDKGCDRAKLLVACLTEQKALFNIGQ